MKRRSFLISMAALPAFAGKWQESSFPDWTPEEIDQLLTKSPWAHEWKGTVDIPFTQGNKAAAESFMQIGGIGSQLPSPIPGIGWPGGGSRTPSTRRSPYPQAPGSGGGRTSDTYRMHVQMVIRWASALPIRRAMALHEFGKERATAMPTLAPSEYIIELTGIPRAIAGGGAEEIERALRKTAAIAWGGHRTLHAVTVDVPSPGATVTAAMHFQRWETETSDSGEIEFTADLGKAHVKEVFKVRLMNYDGRLEL